MSNAINLYDRGVPVISTRKREKRTEAQMIESIKGSPIKEAVYVIDRVAKLENKISALLGDVSQEAREHIFKQCPHLSRY